MNIKEQLIQEIDRIPDALLSEVLDFTLFIKSRYVDEEVSEIEAVSIAESRLAYEEGDYMTVDEFESSLE
jgi:hypothetical protein